MAEMNCFSENRRRRLGDKRGFTFVELLVAIGLSALLTALILAALISSKQICASVTADQDLQQTANVIMNKIIKGASENGITFRLSEATSYTVASLNSLYFVGIDCVERRYFLNNTGRELWYRHPVAGVTSNELIYRAPTGTTLALRFWAGDAFTVGIAVGLAKSVNGRNVVGSATTVINIRNHPTERFYPCKT